MTDRQGHQSARLQILDEYDVINFLLGNFDRPFFVDVKAVFVIKRSPQLVVSHNVEPDGVVTSRPQGTVQPMQEFSTDSFPQYSGRIEAVDEINQYHWGLIPFWADNPDEGVINARSEMADEKRVFQDS